VRHAEVFVSAGKIGRSTAGEGQVGPPAGKILGIEGFGEPDEIREDLPDEVTVRIPSREVRAQARQSLMRSNSASAGRSPRSIRAWA
jgi:hypothetical protein